MTKWEYHIETLRCGSWFGGSFSKTDNLKARANELGDQGWEMVSGTHGNLLWITLLFRRQKTAA